MSLKQIEISLSGCCIKTRNVNTVLANSNEYYNLANIKSVVPIFVPGFGVRDPATNQRQHPYPFDDKIEIEINFIAESQAPPLNFDIQAVSNQAGWTADQAGLDQAVADICGWMCVCCGPSAASSARQGTKTAPEALSVPPDESADFAARDFRNFTFQVDVALNGATDVTVRAEGTLKDAPAADADWDNLDINGNDLVINADGVKLLSVANRKFEFVRLKFVSSIGGGAPIVNVIILGGN